MKKVKCVNCDWTGISDELELDKKWKIELCPKCFKADGLELMKYDNRDADCEN